MHSTDNLDDGYIGSGTYLAKAIRRHGRENFELEILEHLPTREALKLREAELINEDMLKDPMCMNLRLGGEGGWDLVNKNLTAEQRTLAGLSGGFANRDKLSIESLEKLKRVGIENGKRFLSNVDDSGRSKGRDIARSFQSNEKRKKTFESIKHQSGNKNSQFGTAWVNKDGISKKVKLFDVDSLLIEGWIRGRKQRSD